MSEAAQLLDHHSRSPFHRSPVPRLIHSPAATHAKPLPTRQRVALSVTILPSLLNKLQKAVHQALGVTADILGIEPLSRGERIRVRVGVDYGAVGLLIAAVIRALPNGEIEKWSRNLGLVFK